MEKFPQSRAIVEALAGTLCQIVEPVSEATVLRVHSADYINHLKSGTLDAEALSRLGLPWRRELFHRSCLEVGGTVAAVEAALAEGVGANLAGGTHHAFRDRGLGFCVLNDVAIAIHHLRVQFPRLRVLVLDTDAHQGNGTHEIFRGDRRVFTYSIHVGKNYPVTKVAGDWDEELPRWVGGREYLERLTGRVEGILEHFSPDLVIWIAGADCHENDRFGQMRLTDRELERRDRWLAQKCIKTGIPLAIVYGGGYNRKAGHTAWLHAQTLRVTQEVVTEQRRLKA